jgi:hypothetical protein
MLSRLKLALYVLGAGILCVLLSSSAQRPANAIALARFGYSVALIGVLWIATAAVRENCLSGSSGLRLTQRRRLLGFALLLSGIVLAGWLPELNRTTAALGEWLCSQSKLSPEHGRLVRSIFGLKPPPQSAWLGSLLFVVGLALFESGSVRWTVCLIFIPAIYFLIQFLGEPNFAFWAGVGALLLWFIGSFMICPYCGALLQYRRISRQLLSRDQFTQAEPRETPMSATWSDSYGQTRGTMSGSGTQWVYVNRTHSTYRDTYGCSRCRYSSARTVHRVS